MSYYKIRPRSGTATQWATANPILAEREIGYEVPETGFGTGPVRMKMGDGVTAWNDLAYADPETGGSGEDCLTKADIVNNTETDDPTKVASASALKSVSDSLNNLYEEVITATTPTSQSTVKLVDDSRFYNSNYYIKGFIIYGTDSQWCYYGGMQLIFKSDGIYIYGCNSEIQNKPIKIILGKLK